MDLLKFWTSCSMNSIVMSKEQAESFERYYNELVYWNEKVNLISRKDLDNIFERHFIHSLSIIKYKELKKKAKCLDIGTGGGFPGIPLSIVRDDLRMLLVDSIAKKIKLTAMFADHTGNRNIKVRRARVEELHQEQDAIKSFDYIFARAVTETKYIISWSVPLMKPDAEIILLKGGNLEKEIDDASKVFRNFEFEEIPIKIVGFPWFEEEEKKILIIKKMKNEI